MVSGVKCSLIDPATARIVRTAAMFQVGAVVVAAAAIGVRLPSRLPLRHMNHPLPRRSQPPFLAYPGGRIWVDGVLMGSDATGTLSLKPGSHEIRVENRFLGEHKQTIFLSDGQTGVVTIDW